MKILAAKVLKHHGIYGVLKIEVYLDNWLNYLKNIIDENNKTINIINCSCLDKKKNHFLIKLNNVNNIDEAFPYISKLFYILETNLNPLSNNNFYYFQLINLPVKDLQDNTVGVIENIINNGGGDILIIKLNIGTIIYLPFDYYTFPIVEKDKIIISNESLKDIFNQ
jgi:16S rRNA processing protein RimM